MELSDHELIPSSNLPAGHSASSRRLVRWLDRAAGSLRPSERLLRQIQNGILEDLRPDSTAGRFRHFVFGVRGHSSIRAGCWSMLLGTKAGVR